MTSPWVKTGFRSVRCWKEPEKAVGIGEHQILFSASSQIARGNAGAKSGGTYAPIIPDRKLVALKTVDVPLSSTPAHGT